MADRRRHAAIGITVVSAIALVLGWRLFWFLTDDAFIAFRYISNSVAGHGWVWNAAPFRPVDGYTSLAWIALLEAIWRVTGIEPPRSANAVSLVFSLGQLALCLRMLWLVRLPEALDRVRPWLVALAIGGVLTNRTFLAWTSSGLETAMFDFAVLLWMFVAVWRRTVSPRWPVELMAAAVLAALTRPDGMLYAAASAAIVVLELPSLTPDRRRRAAYALACGVLVLATYVVWHRAAYGAWLPNTFYAKVARNWTSAGVRYLASFVLEYALWWWLAVLAFVGIRAAGTARATGPRAGIVPRLSTLAGAVPVLTVIAHVGYYVIVVGGDHFEYRVLAHVVPLVFVSMLWALGRLPLAPARACAVLAAFVVCSWILPWAHWLGTRELNTRETSGNLRHRVARYFPAPISWYAETFDDLQEWLLDRMICVRHQEHKIFYEHKLATLPPREQGEQIGPEGLPVHAAWEAGYVSWVLPNVAIIDEFGLSDYYVARNPERKSMRMAHSRNPPPGYVASFSPNVRLRDGRWVVKPRKKPLLEADVIAAERRYDVWLANLR